MWIYNGYGAVQHHIATQEFNSQETCYAALQRITHNRNIDGGCFQKKRKEQTMNELIKEGTNNE